MTVGVDVGTKSVSATSMITGRRAEFIVMDDVQNLTDQWLRDMHLRWSQDLFAQMKKTSLGKQLVDQEENDRRKEWLRAALRSAEYPSKKVRNIMRRTPEQQKEFIENLMRRADHRHDRSERTKKVVQAYRAAEVAHALTKGPSLLSAHDDRPDALSRSFTKYSK